MGTSFWDLLRWTAEFSSLPFDRGSFSCEVPFEHWKDLLEGDEEGLPCVFLWSLSIDWILTCCKKGFLFTKVGRDNVKEMRNMVAFGGLAFNHGDIMSGQVSRDKYPVLSWVVCLFTREYLALSWRYFWQFMGICFVGSWWQGLALGGWIPKVILGCFLVGKEWGLFITLVASHSALPRKKTSDSFEWVVIGLWLVLMAGRVVKGLFL